jgi:hypothetical protein
MLDVRYGILGGFLGAILHCLRDQVVHVEGGEQNRDRASLQPSNDFVHRRTERTYNIRSGFSWRPSHNDIGIHNQSRKSGLDPPEQMCASVLSEDFQEPVFGLDLDLARQTAIMAKPLR